MRFLNWAWHPVMRNKEPSPQSIFLACEHRAAPRWLPSFHFFLQIIEFGISNCGCRLQSLMKKALFSPIYPRRVHYNMCDNEPPVCALSRTAQGGRLRSSRLGAIASPDAVRGVSTKSHKGNLCLESLTAHKNRIIFEKLFKRDISERLRTAFQSKTLTLSKTTLCATSAAANRR